jgi:preprotein translocase subunit SecA
MTGRRWSDGLHQAVEAKEGVEIERETQTLATITIQNYFRLYHKLAGMTGTAETEAQEFSTSTSSACWSSPPTAGAAQGPNDSVYKTRREKYNAVLARSRKSTPGPAHPRRHHLRRGQRTSLPHAQPRRHRPLRPQRQIPPAGSRDRRPRRPAGSVTIATNMAGRGTDIKLGPGIPELGGLHVLAPNATRPAASTASCAAAAPARATPAPPTSSSRSRTI